jgi:hypothetical protein
MGNNSQTGDKVIVGYWGVGGLAQPIRYILAYGKVDF